MATPTSAPARKPTNRGCLALLIGAPLALAIGLVVGNALSQPDDPPEELHVVLGEGEAAGTAWRVDAVRDVDGATCAFLYEGDATEPLTGACSTEPQDATF